MISPITDAGRVARAATGDPPERASVRHPRGVPARDEATSGHDPGMQRVVGVCVGLVAIFVAYRAWQNTRPDAELEARARAVACIERATCSRAEAEPSSVSRDPFRHVYTFETSAGRMEVTCRWPGVVLGPVRCHGELDAVTATDPHAPEQLPHQIGRGAP